MSKSQHSVAPLAGSTRLFQRAERCRPTRHATNATQVPVAAKARAKMGHENTRSRPGKRRRRLAAGCVGQPLTPAAPDDPDEQSRATEKQQGEPVDESRYAAAQGRQCECGQRSEIGQGQQQDALFLHGDDGRQCRGQHEQQGQSDVTAGTPAPPSLAPSP